MQGRILLIGAVWALSMLIIQAEAAASVRKFVELAFELRDRERHCFHEDIDQLGLKAVLDYQVIHGGELDVDVTVLAPSRRVIHEGRIKRWDTQEWNATETGQYTFCFGNEFSAYSHKLIFFEFEVGPAPGEDDDDFKIPETPSEKASSDLVRFETIARQIRMNLDSIVEAQTRHRLLEAEQRMRAEDIRSRVSWWSAIETVAFVLVGTIQVWVIQSFFSRQHS